MTSPLRGLACLVIVALGARLAAACPVPGAYVTTVTGELPGGTDFARLALDTFTGSCQAEIGSGSVSERFWYWASDARPSAYGPIGVRVGDVLAAPGNVDRGRPIRGLRGFTRAERRVATRTGSWTVANGVVTVTWDDGREDRWRETWADASLHKLELIGASELASTTYLSDTGTRDPSAPSAGWAFGGPGTDLALGVPLVSSMPYLSGLIRRHNAYCDPPAGDAVVYETGFNLPIFQSTTSGTLRIAYADGPLDVYGYLARARRHDGILARAVDYQTSHDFDGDGSIADDLGHTYAGLEVIDASGAFRGLVFADSSRADRDGCGADHTISAIWYLDTYDCDALYGVDPALPGEPCP